MKRKKHLHVFFLVLIASVVFGAMTLTVLSRNSYHRIVEEVFTRLVESGMFRAGTRNDIKYMEPQIESGHMLVNLNDPHTGILSRNMFFYYDYVGFALYRKETGNVISHDQVVAFMSEGGRHREVTKYLNWASGNREAISDYRGRLREIYYEYAAENEGFPLCFPYLLPIKMFDELIEKEAYPDYKMSLTSIQNGFIEEGHAFLFVDGKTIEYQMPSFWRPSQ